MEHELKVHNKQSLMKQIQLRLDVLTINLQIKLHI